MYCAPNLRLDPLPWFVRKLTPVSVFGSQYVTDKIFIASVKGEKYAFWVTLWSIRQDKAEIHGLQYWARQSQAVCIETQFSVSSTPQCHSQVFVCISSPRRHNKWDFFNIVFRIEKGYTSYHKLLSFRPILCLGY